MVNIEVEERQAAGELAVALLKLGYKAAVYEDESGGFHVLDGVPDSSVGTLVLVFDPGKEQVIFAPGYEGPDRRRFERVPFRTPMRVEKIPEGSC